jgi:hypothetical protein
MSQIAAGRLEYGSTGNEHLLSEGAAQSDLRQHKQYPRSHVLQLIKTVHLVYFDPHADALIAQAVHERSTVRGSLVQGLLEENSPTDVLANRGSIEEFSVGSPCDLRGH